MRSHLAKITKFFQSRKRLPATCLNYITEVKSIVDLGKVRDTSEPEVLNIIRSLQPETFADEIQHQIDIPANTSEPTVIGETPTDLPSAIRSHANNDEVVMKKLDENPKILIGQPESLQALELIEEPVAIMDTTKEDLSLEVSNHLGVEIELDEDTVVYSDLENDHLVELVTDQNVIEPPVNQYLIEIDLLETFEPIPLEATTDTDLGSMDTTNGASTDDKDTDRINSVIDLDGAAVPIRYEDPSEEILSEKPQVAPYWGHIYIYSSRDLNEANQEQRKYYKQFKADFLKGDFHDLSGNTNYAFILLFELLEKFEKKDFSLLESRLRTLAVRYPATSYYARRHLLDKMIEHDYEEGYDRLTYKDLLGKDDFISANWRLIYGRKLKLSPEDILLLNDVWISQNSFVSIPQCGLEVTRIYVGIRKALDATYKKRGLDKDAEYKAMMDIIARKQYRYHFGSQNYLYFIQQSQTINGYLLKYAEQVLRIVYGMVKSGAATSASGFEFLENDVATYMYDHTTSLIHQEVQSLIDAIPPIDEPLEIQLNAISSRRWKLSFDLSGDIFNELGKDGFLSKLKEVLSQNVKNRSLEIIHLDVAKYLINYDKQLSLEHFLRYIRENQKRRALVLKPMSKTMIKKLFSTPELQQRYEDVCVRMLNKQINLRQALIEVKDFYIPVRRKIVLDTLAINQAKEQYAETVEVLNDYLQDEHEQELLTMPPSIAQPETLGKGYADSGDRYLVSLTGIQIDLLLLFKKSNWELPADELEHFCQSNGTAKGTLTNNINETCYEVLDDLLIEEEGTSFTINANYYNQILTT